MKTISCLVLIPAMLAAASAFGAQPARPPVPGERPETTLTTFDLDFPGGTPGELVQAIEEAMGRPLNAIVSSELADQQLPPLKMKGVDVADLFRALEQASRSVVVAGTGRYLAYHDVGFGFRTVGAVTDESIWYFYRQGPPPPLTISVSRFYLLTPYLDRGLTVDDITTAIQTGWKMLGESATPSLSFHQETNLLIAVGQEGQLEIIDAVLDALDPRTVRPTTARPRASEAQTKQE